MEKEKSEVDDDFDLGLMDNLASLSWGEVSLLLNEVEQNGNFAPLEGDELNRAFDDDEDDANGKLGSPWPAGGHKAPGDNSRTFSRAKRPLERDTETKSLDDHTPARGHPQSATQAERSYSSAYYSNDASLHDSHAWIPHGPDPGMDLHIPSPHDLHESLPPGVTPSTSTAEGAQKKPAPRASTVSDTREDPAPPGALTFDQVYDLLSRAAEGEFEASIARRHGVSPVNPEGPRSFYVVDRSNGADASNLYEAEQNLARAVRLRSTKKFHWIDTQNGLQYRELAQKERKTGKILDFSGCVYTLAARKSKDAPREIPFPNLQFLQVWYLREFPSNSRAARNNRLQNQHSPSSSPSAAGPPIVSPSSSPAAYPSPAASVSSGGLDSIVSAQVRSAAVPAPVAAASSANTSHVASSSTRLKKEHTEPDEAPEFRGLAISEPAPAPRLGPSDEVQRVAFEIYNRTCSTLDPQEWKSWTEKYGGFLRSENFAKALRLYISRDDPRLKEDFLFPAKQALIDGLPVGNFRATVDVDITTNGGTCVFSDKIFNETVGQDPLGMKGFFVSVLSPLQRLCMSRVWLKRIHESGQSYLEYFATSRITQGAFTLRSGEVKVLRSDNRVLRDEDGNPFIHVRVQDLSHLYPDIVSLPPFLE
ncbi:Hypothetical Protein FCC1311_087052 [Hondaea fermentalgiana]|uniref:Uncharacterized protein n=1 Tax=Hondaea fermentalgiana TaxID=2315210 RepID=A0A2R5GNL9_9STRA|nr:Hypothetical Protein FCC1311_087052 [Hondaea fermentalgiana]|eukprot:GBG32480.1 Hypothetical Protein FCC1311_087052 [Hondaea fermentalgiana]